ncbi:transporter substrate-binding domain-containing protein [Arcanobacterium pinnipediorum]|uniref:Transporter substrate-binding domain-containing protein n=1 Tax=Arcanobacterium pinnipediorum TaxID=1503041 RepID=A0ABY5AFR6_9ACTO|nr:transporter substrate-binding domain-containing protein [Arcanobacterium pinnipediorum]USR78907.1 transporter substrate-binding domain-containing protein [Arcanobacterium pinnipediorum]
MSIIKQISAVAGISLLLAACASTPSATQDSASATMNLLESTEQTKTISVGTEGTYRPYSYTDKDGNLVGIEVDIMKLLAKDLGADVKFTVAPWDGLIAGVDAGKYPVVINNLAVTDERMKKYDFTIPYTRDVAKFAVREDSPLKSIDDLSPQIKAAQSSTSNLGMLAKDTYGLNIVAVDGFVQAVDLVSSGRADVTLNSLVTFKLYQEENGASQIRLLDGEVATPNCCSILVEKGQDEFVAALNEAIERRLADGSIAEITRKYVGEDMSAKVSVP